MTLVPLDPAAPVLVAGASGFVGGHITRILVERGRKVRVLVRNSSSRAAFADLPVDIVVGDALRPETLAAAMHGCQSVFYSIVDPRFWLTDQTPIRRNNIEGLVNAMDAALAAGIGRFIFTSTMGTLGLNPDGPVTEDIAFNWHDSAPPYIEARLEAERALFRYCREKQLPGVALCVANTYGPDDHQPTPHNGMLWEIASGRVKIALDVSQPTVDIRDVAEAALLAETRGRPGERYIIANEYVSNRSFFSMAAAERGLPAPKFISYRAAYAIAWIAERWLKLIGRRDFMIRTDGIYLSNLFRELDSGKARRELGWCPRPLRDTTQDAVAWFAARDAAQAK